MPSTFKSDQIDTVSAEYAYVPIGAMVMLGGAYSKYSDTSYVSAGYIPCDGRSLSTTTYANLFAAIGNAYDTQNGAASPGAGLFRVPNMTSNKLITYPSTSSNAGTQVLGTGAHNHTISLNWTGNTQTANHFHTVNTAFDPVTMSTNDHSHSTPASTINSTAANSASSAGDGTSTSIVGNHTHNVTFSAGTISGVSYNGLSHTHNASTNTSTPTDPTNQASLSTSHQHTISTSSTTVSATTLTFSNNNIGVPYANVLYFIKAL